MVLEEERARGQNAFYKIPSYGVGLIYCFYMQPLPNDYQSDIKDEKRDAKKYLVEARRDPPFKKPLRRLSKEEIQHMNTLKDIVRKHKKS